MEFWILIIGFNFKFPIEILQLEVFSNAMAKFVESIFELKLAFIFNSNFDLGL